MNIRVFIMLGLTAIFNISCRSGSSASTQIVTGAEQTELYLPLLKGKSIALVANHTSRIGRVHLADTLIRSGVKLVRIFSPEHGFRGTAGAGDEINNTIDSLTGVPVTSLYGSRKKPVPDDLKDVDVLIYDIQDVGVRFYTYISTMHYVMEACAEQHIALIILDRPNPLGFYVDGPVLDTRFRSFIGMHPIPVVYGMTAGELAAMVNGENWLAGGVNCDLTIIRCKNYDHSMYYSLPENPSPNLNSMEAIYLYPSLCFFEGTVMSVGRGTDFPFRVVGHPDFPVKNFSFKPGVNQANINPLFLNKNCYGLDFRSMSVEELRKTRQLKLQWLIDTYRTMNIGETFFTDYIDKLAGTDSLRKQVTSGWTEERIRDSWSGDLEKFKVLRKKYLIYDDLPAR